MSDPYRDKHDDDARAVRSTAARLAWESTRKLMRKDLRLEDAFRILAADAFGDSLTDFPQALYDRNPDLLKRAPDHRGATSTAEALARARQLGADREELERQFHHWIATAPWDEIAHEVMPRLLTVLALGAPHRFGNRSWECARRLYGIDTGALWSEAETVRALQRAERIEQEQARAERDSEETP